MALGCKRLSKYGKKAGCSCSRTSEQKMGGGNDKMGGREGQRINVKQIFKRRWGVAMECLKER